MPINVVILLYFFFSLDWLALIARACRRACCLVGYTLPVSPYCQPLPPRGPVALCMGIVHSPFNLDLSDSSVLRSCCISTAIGVAYGPYPGYENSHSS